MIRNALVIFGICATIFVVFLPSYLQMQELHGKNRTYERQIRELGRENEALLEERRRLEEDPAYFERFAREKFGIIKDGEVIYRIVPPGTPGTPGAEAANVNALAAKAVQAKATAKKGTASAAAKKGAAKGKTTTSKAPAGKTGKTGTAQPVKKSTE
jgi:cell division protein FtsB